MTVSTIRQQLFIFSVVASLPGVALAAGPLNLDASGVAIHGHDPVAYFVDGKAVKGRADYSAMAQGATYWFSTEANLMAFKADPAKYQPQFGGYCAYGVANDGLVKVDPDQFTVHEGKLYLNYDASIQKDWLKDIPGFIKKADAKFQSLLAK